MANGSRIFFWIICVPHENSQRFLRREFIVVSPDQVIAYLVTTKFRWLRRQKILNVSKRNMLKLESSWMACFMLLFTINDKFFAFCSHAMFGCFRYGKWTGLRMVIARLIWNPPALTRLFSLTLFHVYESVITLITSLWDEQNFFFVWFVFDDPEIIVGSSRRKDIAGCVQLIRNQGVSIGVFTNKNLEKLFEGFTECF